MKVELLQKAMNTGYSQAVSLDTDCVIVNQEHNIFDASGFWIAVCGCFDSPLIERHLNTGIVVVTRSAEVQDFLVAWNAAPPGGIWEDQSGLIDLMRHRPNRDLLTVLPNRFNCLNVHMEARNPIVRAFHGEPNRRFLLPPLVTSMRH